MERSLNVWINQTQVGVLRERGVGDLTEEHGSEK